MSPEERNPPFRKFASTNQIVDLSRKFWNSARNFYEDGEDASFINVNSDGFIQPLIIYSTAIELKTTRISRSLMWILISTSEPLPLDAGNETTGLNTDISGASDVRLEWSKRTTLRIN